MKRAGSKMARPEGCSCRVCAVTRQLAVDHPRRLISVRECEGRVRAWIDGAEVEVKIDG